MGFRRDAVTIVGSSTNAASAASFAAQIMSPSLPMTPVAVDTDR
jgi:hypothetical protein